jgi:hypothetical protein
LDFDRTVAGLADLAGGAGLAVVEADELDWTWHVRPEDLWAGIAGGVATPGQTYLAQKPEVRARIEREFFAHATDPPFEPPWFGWRLLTLETRME